MVVACAPNKCINTKTAAQALANHDWVRDIKCGLSQEELSQFLQLWNILGDIELSMDQDRHIWKHEASGSFSFKSDTWRVWKSWVLSKRKVFIWLAIKNKCWTADRLARRGLPHPDDCVLCDQEDGIVQHILTSCVFARQFWHSC